MDCCRTVDCRRKPFLLGMLLTILNPTALSFPRVAFLLPTMRARTIAARTRISAEHDVSSVSSTSTSTSPAAMMAVLDKMETARKVEASSATSTTTTNRAADTTTVVTPPAPKLVVVVPEINWRSAAHHHSNRVKDLLRPGLLPPSSSSQTLASKSSTWTALDPSNPIFNFLIEYYGLKGTKGVRRLARWSPDPEMLLTSSTYSASTESTFDSCTICHDNADGPYMAGNYNELHRAVMEASHGLGGILLMNATIDDLGSILHMRGGVPVPHCNDANKDEKEEGRWRNRNRLHGVLYNPSVFYNDMRIAAATTATIEDTITANDRIQRTMAPYQWYSSILEATLNSEPVLHCHGLHEWAMLYHPIGSDAPPSAMYQPNLPLRVSKTIINDAVERAGIRCTHVDALRFFAPDALPLNRHVNLTRMDQVHLEQKACVHAHMDLLKMALKLSSFVDSTLLGDVLELALEARRLDVAASPYDASVYGLKPVPVETREGRKLYRREQTLLMNKAELVRRRLLRAYGVFMEMAFSIR